MTVKRVQQNNLTKVSCSHAKNACWGGDGVATLNTQPIYRSIFGAIGFFSIIAIVVWGFINIPWWQVILGFLGVSLFVVPVVVQRGWLSFLILAQPIFDIGVLIAAIYAWVFI